MEDTRFKYRAFEVITVIFIITYCVGMFIKFMFF